jgi:uncharacterized protein YyaL (SSP411 family)
MLLRLAGITGEDRYRDGAQRALRVFSHKMGESPTALPQMLVALMESLTPPRHVLLSGDREALQPFLEALGQKFLPHHAVLWADSKAISPALANMPVDRSTPTAYVCEDFVCNLPTQNVDRFSELLQ